MELKIGKTLTALIDEKRLTLKEVSEAAKVSISTIQEWKSNRTPRDPAQVLAVANFLGVSLHHLLFGQEDRQEPIQKILMEDFFKGTFEITVRRVKIPEKG